MAAGKGWIVIYKEKLARIEEGGERPLIAIEGGASIKVREKDYLPLADSGGRGIQELRAMAALLPPPELKEARELLGGGKASLAEIAELACGKAGPAELILCFESLRDSDEFKLEGLEAQPRSDAEIEARLAKRADKEGKEAAIKAFAERARAGLVPKPEDSRIVQEIEALARGEASRSKAMKELKLEESPEAAHELLLKLGAWTSLDDPYPYREGLSRKSPDMVEEGFEDPLPRADLRAMEAFAIDSPWSHDPDDAVSYHEGALWVHVADPASVLHPGGALDREARGRGATLYLPELCARMLPDALLDRFGLGLSEESPALSFKIELGSEPRLLEITPSVIRVRRVSYEEAEVMLGEGPLGSLMEIALANEARRAKAGAVTIELPEQHIELREGEVHILPIAKHRSSILVREAMLLAGEACARWARDRGIAFPYSTQEPPGQEPQDIGKTDEASPWAGLAAQYALRRIMKPRLLSPEASQHAGLGLAVYAQVTSPLRRYSDLLAHMQLRAFLAGRPTIDADDMRMAIAEAEAGALKARRAERSARQHFRIAYLMAKGKANYEAVLVDRPGGKAQLLVPSIGIEAKAAGFKNALLDATVIARFEGANLARLDARFSEGKR